MDTRAPPPFLSDSLAPVVFFSQTKRISSEKNIEKRSEKPRRFPAAIPCLGWPGKEVRPQATFLLFSFEEHHGFSHFVAILDKVGCFASRNCLG